MVDLDTDRHITGVPDHVSWLEHKAGVLVNEAGDRLVVAQDLLPRPTFTALWKGNASLASQSEQTTRPVSLQLPLRQKIINPTQPLHLRFEHPWRRPCVADELAKQKGPLGELPPAGPVSELGQLGLADINMGAVTGPEQTPRTGRNGVFTEETEGIVTKTDLASTTNKSRHHLPVGTRAI